VEPAASEKSADRGARDRSARDRSARENARERAPGGATAPLAFWTPALLLLAGLAVYAGGLWLHTGEILPQSRWPYFAYYAQALLDGQLHFSQLPPARLDLSEFDGRLYMHFPPFPAVLLAPFVAVFGVEIADRLLCATLGAVNGVGFYFLLGALDREALIRMSERARIFLSLFFLFGTVHFYLAITSNPWELAHVVCNALVIVALALTLRRRMALAALALAAILFTRTHVFLVAPVLAGIFWRLEARDGSDAAPRIRQLLPFAAIGCAAVGALLVFNEARFGDPFENGVRYHAMHESFRERYSRLGYFDVAYLGQNLHALLLRLPVPSSGFPWLSFQTEGLSLFLASPLYLYLFASLRRPTRSLATLLWGGIVLASVPILLLMGTGENQFGHRYSSDLEVLLILLTFLGMGMQVTRTSLALLGASILMNAWGAWWFVSHYAQ
jgi:hypothetical protein